MSSNTPKIILLLAANPKGTTPLRLDEEVREIDSGLQRAKHREQFVLEQKWAVRPRDIQRAMLDLNPSIVHFAGHGTEDEGLVFEDESGIAKLVDGESLAGLFELFAERVECVVLNGCYSRVQASAIAIYVNYVIGMNKAIGDRAAIEFAVAFYDALGAGRPVEFAYKLGCAAIQLAGIPEHLTPVLKKKLGVGDPIVKISSPSEQLASTKEAEAVEELKTVNKTSQNRSVSIGGSAIGSAIQTGDSNTASVQFKQTTLPAPENVNIRAEIDAICSTLAKLETADRPKIDNAFADAKQELKKPEPDKDEVGQALERALNYGKKAEGFVQLIEKLEPHLTKATAWLGENWHKLLSVVGLTT